MILDVATAGEGPEVAIADRMSHAPVMAPAVTLHRFVLMPLRGTMVAAGPAPEQRIVRPAVPGIAVAQRPRLAAAPATMVAAAAVTEHWVVVALPASPTHIEVVTLLTNVLMCRRAETIAAIQARIVEVPLASNRAGQTRTIPVGTVAVGACPAVARTIAQDARASEAAARRRKRHPITTAMVDGAWQDPAAVRPRVRRIPNAEALLRPARS